MKKVTTTHNTTTPMASSLDMALLTFTAANTRNAAAISTMNDTSAICDVFICLSGLSSIFTSSDKVQHTGRPRAATPTKS